MQNQQTKQTQIQPSVRDQLTKLAAPLNLETITTNKILDVFVPLCAEAGSIARSAETVIVTDASQVDAIKQSGVLLKQIATVRKTVEKNRKAMKEEYLRPGQFIDATARKIAELIDPVETRLEDQAKFVERQREAAEQKLAQERASVLIGLGIPDPANYYPMPLGKLGQQQWDDLEAGAKRRQAEAQQQEADRLAAEQARALENQRLADENAKLQAERDQAAERERLATEARVKAEAETKRLSDEAAKRDRDAKLAAARRARAPDKEKLLAYAKAIMAVSPGELKSEEAKLIAGEAAIDFAAVCNVIIEQANKL